MAHNNGLMIGAIIEKDEKKYRVIDCNEEYITLCELETTSMNIFFANVQVITEEIVKGTCSVSFTEPEFVNVHDLTAKQKEEYEYRVSVANRLRNEYGPDYVGWISKKKKPVLEEIVMEGRMTRRSIQRMFNSYIQSGFSEYALADPRWFGTRPRVVHKKKTVEKDAKSINFDYALEIYKDARGSCSYRHAFDIMLGVKYSNLELVDGKLTPVLRTDVKIPTFRQFDYYKSKVFSKTDKEKVLLGDAKFRNDNRIRLGSSDTGVYGPYDLVEMDAVEFDVSLTGT